MRVDSHLKYGQSIFTYSSRNRPVQRSVHRRPVHSLVRIWGSITNIFGTPVAHCRRNSCLHDRHSITLLHQPVDWQETIEVLPEHVVRFSSQRTVLMMICLPIQDLVQWGSRFDSWSSRYRGVDLTWDVLTGGTLGLSLSISFVIPLCSYRSRMVCSLIRRWCWLLNASEEVEWGKQKVISKKRIRGGDVDVMNLLQRIGIKEMPWCANKIICPTFMLSLSFPLKGNTYLHWQE